VHGDGWHGVLSMTDEKGPDSKILAVPCNKVSNVYSKVLTYEDLPETLVHSISHFFEHYKDLEPNKWVNVDGWHGVKEAKQEILDSIARNSA